MLDYYETINGDNVEFTMDQLLAEKKVKEIKTKKLLIISLAGLCGIGISLYSLLQSNIPINIIIYSVAFTLIVFSIIVYLIFFKSKKLFVKYDQKIIFSENEIIYYGNNKIIKILTNQIKSVLVIRKNNGIISQIIIKGPKKIIIQSTIENITGVLAEIEKRIDSSILKNQKFNYLNIFTDIGTAPLIFILMYKLLAISLILFSFISIIFEISNLKDSKIEVIDGYIINFPTEPKIEQKEIDNALLTSYSCQSNNSSYLVEKFDLNNILMTDPEYYFKDLAENYGKTTKTNIEKFDYNDEMMSLTLISDNRDVFIEIKRIIVSENILLNSIIYTKTEKGLNSSQSNNFSKSILGNYE